jgi:hypothetical protein
VCPHLCPRLFDAAVGRTFVGFCVKSARRELPVEPAICGHLTDLRHYTVVRRGSHFVAMEYPELMAADVRAFFLTCCSILRSAEQLTCGSACRNISMTNERVRRCSSWPNDLHTTRHDRFRMDRVALESATCWWTGSPCVRA